MVPPKAVKRWERLVADDQFERHCRRFSHGIGNPYSRQVVDPLRIPSRYIGRYTSQSIFNSRVSMWLLAQRRWVLTKKKVNPQLAKKGEKIETRKRVTSFAPKVHPPPSKRTTQPPVGAPTRSIGLKTPQPGPLPLLFVQLEDESSPCLVIRLGLHPLDSLWTLRKIIEAEFKANGAESLIGEWTFSDFKPVVVELLRGLLEDFRSFYTDNEYLRVDSKTSTEVRYSTKCHREQIPLLAPRVAALERFLEQRTSLFLACRPVKIPNACMAAPSYFFPLVPFSKPVQTGLPLLRLSDLRNEVKPLLGAVRSQFVRRYNGLEATLPPPTECGLYRRVPTFRSIARTVISDIRREKAKRVSDSAVASPGQASQKEEMKCAPQLDFVRHQDQRQLFLPVIRIKRATAVDNFTEGERRLIQSAVWEIETMCNPTSYVSKQSLQEKSEKVKKSVSRIEEILKSNPALPLSHRNDLGQSLLHLAALADIPDFAPLLQRRIDIRIPDNRGLNILHLAARHNKLDYLKALVPAVRTMDLDGALTMKNQAGRTPIEEAALANHWDIVMLLREYSKLPCLSVDEAAACEKCYSPEATVASGDVTSLRWWIERSGTVATDSVFGELKLSLLHTALSVKTLTVQHLELLAFLVSRKPKLLPDSCGRTPLHLSACRGLWEWILPILESCDPTAQESVKLDRNGDSFLHQMIAGFRNASWRGIGSEKILQDVFQSKWARPVLWQRNSRGKTPLHCAMEARCVPAAKLLSHLLSFESAALVNSVLGQSDDETPLHFAIRSNFPEGVTCLLRNADWVPMQMSVNESCERSIIRFAVECHSSRTSFGSPDVAIEDNRSQCDANLHHNVLHLLCSAASTDPELLRKEINRTSGKSRKETALHTAVRYGLWHDASLLLRFGASLQLCDSDGKTPLRIACESQTDVSLPKLLLANTQDVGESLLSLESCILAEGAVAQNLEILRSVFSRFPADLETITPTGFSLGETFLLSAARTNNLPLISMLLERGARASAVGVSPEDNVFASLLSTYQQTLRKANRNSRSRTNHADSKKRREVERTLDFLLNTECALHPSVFVLTVATQMSEIAFRLLEGRPNDIDVNYALPPTLDTPLHFCASQGPTATSLLLTLCKRRDVVASALNNARQSALAIATAANRPLAIAALLCTGQFYRPSPPGLVTANALIPFTGVTKGANVKWATTIWLFQRSHWTPADLLTQAIFDHRKDVVLVLADSCPSWRALATTYASPGIGTVAQGLSRRTPLEVAATCGDRTTFQCVMRHHGLRKSDCIDALRAALTNGESKTALALVREYGAAAQPLYLMLPSAAAGAMDCTPIEGLHMLLDAGFDLGETECPVHLLKFVAESLPKPSPLHLRSRQVSNGTRRPTKFRADIADAVLEWVLGRISVVTESRRSSDSQFSGNLSNRHSVSDGMNSTRGSPRTSVFGEDSVTSSPSPKTSFANKFKFQNAEGTITPAPTSVERTPGKHFLKVHPRIDIATFEVLVCLGLSKTVTLLLSSHIESLDFADRLSTITFSDGRSMLSALLRLDIPDAVLGDLLDCCRGEVQEREHRVWWSDILCTLAKAEGPYRGGSWTPTPFTSLVQTVTHSDILTTPYSTNARSLLHDLVASNRPGVLQHAISNGPPSMNLDLKDKSGNTALSLAAKLGRTECASCLVSFEVDVMIEDRRGLTALHHAANTGSIEIVELLLAAENGPDAACNPSTRQYASYPVIAALRSGKDDCAIVLLTHLACESCPKDIVVPTTGETIIHIAAAHDNESSLQWLLKALPNSFSARLTKEGWSAADFCREESECERLLAQAAIVRVATSTRKSSLGLTGKDRLFHQNLVAHFGCENAIDLLLLKSEVDLQGLSVNEKAWLYAWQGKDSELWATLKAGEYDMQSVVITGLPSVNVSEEKERQKICSDIVGALYRFGGVSGGIQLKPEKDGISATLRLADPLQRDKLLQMEDLVVQRRVVTVGSDTPKGPTYRTDVLPGRSTLLHHAVRTNCAKSLKFIIDNNSYDGVLDYRVALLIGTSFDENGLTPFHLAVFHRRWELVAWFSRCQVPQIPDAISGFKPLDLISSPLQAKTLKLSAPTAPTAAVISIENVTVDRLNKGDEDALCYSKIITEGSVSVRIRQERNILTAILGNEVATGLMESLKADLDRSMFAQTEVFRQLLSPLLSKLQLSVDTDGAECQDTTADRERLKALMLYSLKGGAGFRAVQEVFKTLSDEYGVYGLVCLSKLRRLHVFCKRNRLESDICELKRTVTDVELKQGGYGSVSCVLSVYADHQNATDMLFTAEIKAKVVEFFLCDAMVAGGDLLSSLHRIYARFTEQNPHRHRPMLSAKTVPSTRSLNVNSRLRFHLVDRSIMQLRRLLKALAAKQYCATSLEDADGTVDGVLAELQTTGVSSKALAGKVSAYQHAVEILSNEVLSWADDNQSTRFGGDGLGEGCWINLPSQSFYVPDHCIIHTLLVPETETNSDGLLDLDQFVPLCDYDSLNHLMRSQIPESQYPSLDLLWNARRGLKYERKVVVVCPLKTDSEGNLGGFDSSRLRVLLGSSVDQRSLLDPYYWEATEDFKPLTLKPPGQGQRHIAFSPSSLAPLEPLTLGDSLESQTLLQSVGRFENMQKAFYATKRNDSHPCPLHHYLLPTEERAVGNWSSILCLVGQFLGSPQEFYRLAAVSKTWFRAVHSGPSPLKDLAESLSQRLDRLNALKSTLEKLPSHQRLRIGHLHPTANVLSCSVEIVDQQLERFLTAPLREFHRVASKLGFREAANGADSVTLLMGEDKRKLVTTEKHRNPRPAPLVQEYFRLAGDFIRLLVALNRATALLPSECEPRAGS